MGSRWLSVLCAVWVTTSATDISNITHSRSARNVDFIEPVYKPGPISKIDELVTRVYLHVKSRPEARLAMMPSQRTASVPQEVSNYELDTEVHRALEGSSMASAKVLMSDIADIITAEVHARKSPISSVTQLLYLLKGSMNSIDTQVAEIVNEHAEQCSSIVKSYLDRSSALLAKINNASMPTGPEPDTEVVASSYTKMRDILKKIDDESESFDNMRKQHNKENLLKLQTAQRTVATLTQHILRESADDSDMQQLQLSAPSSDDVNATDNLNATDSLNSTGLSEAVAFDLEQEEISVLLEMEASSASHIPMRLAESPAGPTAKTLQVLRNATSGLIDFRRELHQNSGADLQSSTQKASYVSEPDVNRPDDAVFITAFRSSKASEAVRKQRDEALLLQLGQQRRRMQQLCDTFEDARKRLEAKDGTGAIVSLPHQRVLADILQLLEAAAAAAKDGAPAYMQQTFDAVWQALPLIARDIRVSARASGIKENVRVPSIVTCVALVHRGDSIRSLAQAMDVPFVALLRVNTQLPPRVRLHGAYPTIGTPIFMPAASLQDVAHVKRCRPWPSVLAPLAVRQFRGTSQEGPEPLHEIDYAHAEDWDPDAWFLGGGQLHQHSGAISGGGSLSGGGISLVNGSGGTGGSGIDGVGTGRNGGHHDHDERRAFQTDECECPRDYSHCQSDGYCYKSETSYEYSEFQCPGNCTKDAGPMPALTKEGYGWVHSEIGGRMAKWVAAAATGAASDDWAQYLSSGRVDSAEHEHNVEQAAISGIAAAAASASKLYAQTKYEVAKMLPPHQHLEVQDSLPGLEPEGLVDTPLRNVSAIEKLMHSKGGDLNNGTGVAPINEVLLQIKEQQLQHDEKRVMRRRMRGKRGEGTIEPGQKVWGFAPGMAKYNEGTIKRARSDGTYEVKYVDKTSRRVPLSAVLVHPPKGTKEAKAIEKATAQAESIDEVQAAVADVLASAGEIHVSGHKGDFEPGAQLDGMMGTLCGSAGEPCWTTQQCSGHGSYRHAVEGSDKPAGCMCDDGYEGNSCASCQATHYEMALTQKQRRGVVDVATMECHRCAPTVMVSSAVDASLGAVPLAGVENVASCTAAAAYVVLGGGSGGGLRGSEEMALTRAELLVASSHDLKEMDIQVELHTTDVSAVKPVFLDEVSAVAIARFNNTLADGWSSFTFGEKPVEAKQGGSYFIVLRQPGSEQVQWNIGATLDRGSPQSHAWKLCDGEWEEERLRESPRYALRLVSCHF